MQPILVVEDDLPLRTTVRAILEDEGWGVETAGDEVAAMECVARARPALVVLDWGLREFDAQSLAAALRKSHGPDVPILLVTGDGQAAQKAERVGALTYLRKPFEIDEFIKVVRTILHGRDIPDFRREPVEG
jgi:two-component system, chemotaxis family, chemotaxis protein CheY